VKGRSVTVRVSACGLLVAGTMCASAGRRQRAAAGAHRLPTPVGEAVEAPRFGEMEAPSSIAPSRQESNQVQVLTPHALRVFLH